MANLKSPQFHFCQEMLVHFFLTGVDVTGTYVYSSSVNVDESVTLITSVVPPVITCVVCPSEGGDPEENASMGCTSVPK